MRNIFFRCNIYIYNVHVYLLYPLSFVGSHSWCPSSLSLQCHSFPNDFVAEFTMCHWRSMADFEVPKLHPWPLDHDPPFLQQTSMLHFVDEIYIYIYIFASRKGWSWNLSGARSCYIPSRWVVPYIYIYIWGTTKNGWFTSWKIRR